MRHEPSISGDSDIKVAVLEGKEIIRVYVETEDGYKVRLDVQRTERGVYVRSNAMMLSVIPSVSNAVYVDAVGPEYRPGGRG